MNQETDYFKRLETAIPLSKDEFFQMMVETKEGGDPDELKKNIYTNKIRRYFEERPALDLTKFCEEAGIFLAMLEALRSGDQLFTPEIYAQIKDTLHHYGRLS